MTYADVAPTPALPRRSRRSVLTALVATAVMLLTCSTAQSAPGGEVTIAPQGGEPATLSLVGLEPQWDVRDRTYTVRGATGDSSVSVSGISVDRLLDRAGVDPYGFASMTISGGGRTVTLDRDQLTDPDAFAEGRPVLYVDAGGTHFLRPSTGPGDLNADDAITVPDGPLAIALTATSELEVAASASRERIERGQQVTFDATLSGAAAGERVRVSWSFDDGRSATGTRVTHRFTRPGTYKVVVGATSDANPAGASAVLRIRVGKPPAGPDRSGGGTNPDVSAPDSGAATGATGGSAPAPAPAPTPAPPAAELRAAPASAPPPAKPVEPLPADQRKALEQAVPGGTPESVEGVLLSEASLEPTAAKADALRAARSGDPKHETASVGSVPPAAIGSFAVLALLGLGAWWERRGLPRRKPD